MKQRLAILGSTGSIGVQTLDIVRENPDFFEVRVLTANSNWQRLAAQAREFDADTAVIADKRYYTRLRDALEDTDVKVYAGEEAVAQVAAGGGTDVVVNALVGYAGLAPTVAAIEAGKKLALANKESLVVGGDLIMPMAAEPGRLMPIDSEHGAIYQCLLGEDPREVSRLWVTASGGPFRGRTRADLADITPAQALAHPTWNMGAKISIDSSTLMNKGLEVIEAHHLFAMSYDRISVVVQPQSAIHSMVEYSDGSVKAHLGTTDMRIPIQFALSYPERWDAPVEPLDFTKLGTLEFAAPDTDTFRCLALARAAGERGGTLPCVMNAANEVAVAAFLAEEGSYLGIAACVEAVMDAHERQGVQRVESLDQLEELDAWARAEARRNVR